MAGTKTKAKKKKEDKLPPDPSWRKPTSPSRRKEAWTTVIIRAHVYAMIRELADHHDIPIGEIVRIVIEQEFKKTLWKVQQEELRSKREGDSVDKA